MKPTILVSLFRSSFRYACPENFDLLPKLVSNRIELHIFQVLMEMFQQENVLNQNHEKSRDHKKAQPYDEVVKDLIIDEKQYLRDQHMITKVFREILQKDSIGNQQEIDAIFSNIIEITELTVNLISSLEDTLEMTEEGNPPMVGPCFEELAEAEEFDVYIKYTKDILSPVCRQTLYNLLPKQSDALRTCGKGFREAIKFYLPELLLGPIHHCFHYFNYIEVMYNVRTSPILRIGNSLFCLVVVVAHKIHTIK